MATRSANYIYDDALEMKDAGAISADAAAQVGGSNKILDTGDDDSIFQGVAVIDISAIDLVTGDEFYNLILEGSDSSTFASGVEQLAVLRVGNSGTVHMPNDSADSDIGRYILPFRNERNGRRYRYLRFYTDVGGTTPSINYKAYLSVGKKG